VGRAADPAAPTRARRRRRRAPGWPGPHPEPGKGPKTRTRRQQRQDRFGEERHRPLPPQHPERGVALVKRPPPKPGVGQVDLANSPVRYHGWKLEGCSWGKVKPSSEQEADIPAKILTVGQAATRAGLTAKAVRLYEARGLLPPTERTSSGYRCYTEHDIQLLRFIRQARDLGLSLTEIRTIIGLRRGETPPGREVITLLQAHLDAIDHKISSLQHLRQAMTGVLHAAAAHADQGGLVPLCHIIDPASQHPPQPPGRPRYQSRRVPRASSRSRRPGTATIVIKSAWPSRPRAERSVLAGPRRPWANRVGHITVTRARGPTGANYRASPGSGLDFALIAESAPRG